MMRNTFLGQAARSIAPPMPPPIAPGKYDEASKLMKQLQDQSGKYGLPQGRVLSGHFVSPGQPNWHWETEYGSITEATAALDKFDEMPEMETIGLATYGVWKSGPR